MDQQDIPWVVSCQYTAAWSLWLLGYADQAAHRTRAALDLFQQLLPYGRAFFLNVTALMHRFRGEPQAVREHAEAAIEIATEHGFALMQARGTTLRGWALAAQGHREDGIAELRQGLDALRTAGQHAPLHYPLALVEAYRHVGQATAGLQLVTEIEALLETSDERLWQAELFRLKGELLLQSGDQRHGAEVWTPEATPETLQAEAEACFLEAFAVARSQQARSLELRAAMSLSRLRQQQGRRDDARQLLTEIYDWFTEGFDTADLQEARALLAKLP